MTYKNKLIFLVSLIAVLALLLTGNLIFNSDIGNKQSSFVWIDSKTAEKVTRIAINAEGQEFEIVYNSNQWSVLYNDTVYPARIVRINDFLNILTKRAAWQVRSSSASNHERFGLTQSTSNVKLYFDNTILLDLLIGNDDVFKNETYFRKAGDNEVISGDSSIKNYITGPITNWYNLRLIPESEGMDNNAAQLDVNSVQRLSVYNEGETLLFSRRNRAWAIEGLENLNISAIESYIRTILNTEGDNFADPDFISESFNDNIRIVIELGNGRIITIRLTTADDTGRRYAQVSGRNYIYSIPSWSAGRMFRNLASFEAQ